MRRGGSNSRTRELSYALLLSITGIGPHGQSRFGLDAFHGHDDQINAVRARHHSRLYAKHLSQRLRGDYVGGRSVREDLATAEHDYSARIPAGLIEVVQDHDDGEAVLVV
jgi:hypothetical protein